MVEFFKSDAENSLDEPLEDLKNTKSTENESETKKSILKLEKTFGKYF
jgi:hypothetical protein